MVSRADLYPAALLGIFAAAFAALGIAPNYRQDWLLENLLVFVSVPLLVATRHRLRFSDASYTLLFILSNSAIYELIEWAAAVAFGGDLGTAYLGTQGDEWDSQKDTAFAAGGALIAQVFSCRRSFMRKTTDAAPRVTA